MHFECDSTVCLATIFLSTEQTGMAISTGSCSSQAWGKNWILFQMNFLAEMIKKKKVQKAHLNLNVQMNLDHFCKALLNTT